MPKPFCPKPRFKSQRPESSEQQQEPKPKLGHQGLIPEKDKRGIGRPSCELIEANLWVGVNSKCRKAISGTANKMYEFRKPTT